MIVKLINFIWLVFIVGVFIYCVWLFFETVDAHLTGQMNLWSKNLGM